jgi:Mg2+-importing ATPase
LGFLLFSDPPRSGVSEALEDMHALGVQLKLITGDDRRVARHIATAVGLGGDRLVTGRELAAMRDEALWRLAERTDIFAEVDPNQKERILLALKKTGHVVGYMGDGINDAPALHCADVSISVEGAADVAREAADFVLLERDVEVLGRGIRDGRMTFANTLKYVLTTESANLGNMVSMALASLFLPFLPLTATQVLLNNLLSDVPALSLARDSVDPELVQQPRRWNMAFIWRYMLEFGLLSSLFDFLTFGVVLRVFPTEARAFQSAWFVESLLTELAVALVIRTRRRFWKSAPARALWLSSALVALVAVALPFAPRAEFLGFEPLPAGLVLALLGITALYVLATEALKGSFYRRVPA